MFYFPVGKRVRISGLSLHLWPFWGGDGGRDIWCSGELREFLTCISAWEDSKFFPGSRAQKRRGENVTAGDKSQLAATCLWCFCCNLCKVQCVPCCAKPSCKVHDYRGCLIAPWPFKWKLSFLSNQLSKRIVDFSVCFKLHLTSKMEDVIR